MTMENYSKRCRVTRRMTLGITLLSLLVCALDSQAGWGRPGVRPDPLARYITVQDGSSATLGLYAGIINVQVDGGAYQSAFLVVSQQGYVIPLLANGEVAVIGPVYFQSSNCSGTAYVKATVAEPVLTGLPGTVFRSMQQNRLVYIPTGSSAAMQMTLRSSIDNRRTPVCKTESVTGRFYRLETNRAEITGYDRHTFQGPLSVVPPRLHKNSRASGTRAPVTADDASGYSDAVDYQAECSPGCLPEDVGNADCDIACWTAECGYDGGDCDDVPHSELEEKVLSICSPGCFVEDINDGFCDAVCNNEQCSFDGEDCKQQLMD